MVGSGNPVFACSFFIVEIILKNGNQVNSGAMKEVGLKFRNVRVSDRSGDYGKIYKNDERKENEVFIQQIFSGGRTGRFGFFGVCRRSP
jgi:hypothetical protein